MDFSEALQALKAGEQLTRPVWNPDTFITLMPGYPDGIAINAATAKATRLPLGTMLRFYPYILLVEPEGCAQWVHDDDDLLTEDWMIHETAEEATAEVLANPQMMADIAAAEAEWAAGVTPTDARQIVEKMRMRRVVNAVESYLEGWRESNAATTDFTGDEWGIFLRGSRDGDRDRLHSIEVEARRVPSEEEVNLVMRRLGEAAPPGGVTMPVNDERPWWRKEGFRQAVIWMVAGTINHHILCDSGSEECEGCCPNCCGPCHALAWLRDNEDATVTRWLNRTDPGASWIWQRPDGSINWAMIEAHWKPEKLGCVERHH